MNRRTMLTLSASGVATFFVAQRHAFALAPGMVTIAEYSDAGICLDVKQVPKVVKPESEWRRELTPLSFEITRHADTEQPFTGATWNLHEKGLFRCICCGNALYSSTTKFDSGTGWPSFWAPLDKRNIVELDDRSMGMDRTAISCKLCDAHLGHVFEDGPKPTGLRYCMNSAAMRFIKASA